MSSALPECWENKVRLRFLVCLSVSRLRHSQGTCILVTKHDWKTSVTRVVNDQAGSLWLSKDQVKFSHWESGVGMTAGHVVVLYVVMCVVCECLFFKFLFFVYVVAPLECMCSWRFSNHMNKRYLCLCVCFVYVWKKVKRGGERESSTMIVRIRGHQSILVCLKIQVQVAIHLLWSSQWLS